MRGAVRSLLLLTLALGAMGAALPEPPGDLTADDSLAWNQQKLEEWRANPRHAARLQRDLDRFWSLPREERDRLRELDRELHEQDSATQSRLWGVLERYHAWMERLPESDRKRINAASGDHRLAIIKEIREQQWVEHLPERIRNELKAMPADKRVDRVAELKKEERLRIQDALRTHPPVRPKKDRPSKLSEFPTEVQLFVGDSLHPLLTPQERETLRRAENQPWPTYARTLSEMAARHPIPLPGPVGPVRLSDLRGELGNHLQLGNPFRDRKVAL
jgi:hypothetical protein